jgi:hypothetical protein
MTDTPQAELAAAVLLILDGRAGNAAVAAEDAAVTRLRLEPDAASAALMEERAGIRRHCFLAAHAALRTRNDAFENYASHF